ncbi:MAG: hypothetical protein NT068_01385 [Candidatus Nomurabacteria bacterium]|nr:hypothetical protein [Candidatus Nomurabacteria bacterium]
MDMLKTRYEAVLQSSSDSLFYQNVDRYIEYIVKTPALAEIMDKAEKAYNTEFPEIWDSKTNNEEEIKKRAERTSKLERFNLYASHYVTLKVRIYDPLEDYKTTNEDDKDQDPVALLMLNGIKNSRIQKYMKEAKADFDKWNPKHVKSYNEWYEGQRQWYENQLKQFHVDFLSEVAKIEIPIEEKNILPTTSKIIIVIDDKKGIYRGDNKDLCYEIEYGSERQKLIAYLFPKDRVSLSDIEIQTNRTGKKELIMKEIRQINDLFRTKLDLNKDLISSLPTGGYCLSKDEFDIRMNPKNL